MPVSVMEDETRVSENTIPIPSSGSEEVRPSYWLDACEDLSCDLIGDLVDFDVSSVAPNSNGNQDAGNCNQEEDGLVNDFFGGLDHILDSIKNGAGLPSIPDFNDSADGTSAFGNGTRSYNSGEGCFQNGVSGISKTVVPVESSTAPLNGTHLNNIQNEGRNSEYNGEAGRGNKSVNGNGEQKPHLPPERIENGVQKYENFHPNEVARDKDVGGDERCSKRARFGSCKNDKYCSGRGQYHPRERERDRERFSSRKRPRDLDDIDRRDRDHVRRKEHYNNNRRDGREREWRDREPKGYWERDKSGSNELVFRFGSYESDRHRVGKVANDKNQECNGKAEDKPEEPKEKIPEEQARKYQLDVLEQAKNRNTIAFLETGAGKTLIAVLLIKSLCNDLQKQNKKLLAVFLVPKVPLVYQVTLTWLRRAVFCLTT